MSGNSQCPRSAVIFRHTEALLRDTRMSMATLAARVCESYHGLLPPDARVVSFKAGGDVFGDAYENAKKLHRYIDPEVNARLPADLEEAWVLALPEPYQSHCLAELLDRYGCRLVRKPAATSGAPAGVAHLVEAFGNLMVQLAPAMKSLDAGSIEPLDARGAAQALQTLRVLYADLCHVEQLLLPGGAQP